VAKGVLQCRHQVESSWNTMKLHYLHIHLARYKNGHSLITGHSHRGMVGAARRLGIAKAGMTGT
jgi:hypothetical protein